MCVCPMPKINNMLGMNQFQNVSLQHIIMYRGHEKGNKIR